MSIHFFITPYDPQKWESSTSNLKIDKDNFHEAFLSVWENAKVEATPEGGLLWQIPEINSAGFFGGLASDGKTVSFNPGNWITFIDFVLWYRSFVPEVHTLYLFNSSSDDSLILSLSVTRQDIEKFTGGK